MPGKIYISIRTIPSMDSKLRDEIMRSIEVPKDVSKEELERWDKEDRPKIFHETLVQYTSRASLEGEIAAIAYAFDDQEVKVLSRDMQESETGILLKFFRDIDTYSNSGHPASYWPMFVGYGISQYDLLFLYHRSIVRMVEPVDCMPYPCELGDHNDKHFEDIGMTFFGSGNIPGISIILNKLNMSTDGVPMSDVEVWEHFRNGELETIEEDAMETVSLYRVLDNRIYSINDMATKKKKVTKKKKKKKKVAKKKVH